MSRILIAWELGANLGHLTRLLPIAEILQQQAHQVLFVVRDTEAAAVLLEPRGFAFISAPYYIGKTKIAQPPVNYAELLIADAYLAKPSLIGRIRSWLALYQLYKPDIILIDYAPSALLAAHIEHIPAVCIDNGFGMPPLVSPMPTIRPFETVSTHRLSQAETLVLTAINAVSHHFQGPLFKQFVELFNTQATILATFPELDHYGVREHGDYVGPIFSYIGSLSASWQTETKTKIFAYLRPDMPGLQALLKVLASIDTEVVCVIPGLTRLNRELAKKLRVYTQPVLLNSFIVKANLVISYAGSGLTANALLAGVPLLLLPYTIEQYLQARRIEQLGAGLMLNQERSESVIKQALDKILSEPHFHKAASDFAVRHVGFHPAQAANYVVKSIEAIIQRQSIKYGLN